MSYVFALKRFRKICLQLTKKYKGKNYFLKICTVSYEYVAFFLNKGKLEIFFSKRYVRKYIVLKNYTFKCFFYSHRRLC